MTSTTSGPVKSKGPLVLDSEPVSIEDVIAIARDGRQVEIGQDPEFRERLHRGARVLEDKWRANETIYGVTTGVGDSCESRIPADIVPQFSRQLTRMHGCGLGRHFDAESSAAVLVGVLSSLKRGYSGVRIEVLEALCRMLNHRVLPLIPEEGSVGASGDLTPLSYVAAALMGEREVLFDGRVRPAAEVLRELEFAPLELRAKEGLAIMNGTAVMTAIACRAHMRARYLVRLCSRLTAMASRALKGNAAHFDPRLFAQKPHPGQAQVAHWIAEDLGYSRAYQHGPGERIQDTYAIRCAPHVIGVLADALPWMRTHIETELNSACDNPLVDPDTGDVLHGGNFYGGHIAFAMDAMKNAVANLADLEDRQIALLVNEKSNRGLPPNLSGAAAARLPINHGFKALQIGCSAWAAEALKLTMPASVFSRSTESHNQDKVSMGTIAARDCMRILDLTEQVVAGTLLAATQALDLRVRMGATRLDDFSPGLRRIYQQVREIAPFVEEDRPLEGELRALLAVIRSGELAVPEAAS